MRFRLTHFFSSGLWGAMFPYVLLPVGLFLFGTFLSGSPPNLDLRSSIDFVIRLLKEEFMLYEPFAATWLGWRTQSRRVAYYSGLFFTVLTLYQAFR